MIIYFFLFILLNSGGVTDFDMRAQIMTIESDPVLLRMEYQTKVANEYGQLESSMPVIKAFLNESMQLDNMGTVWGLKHSKRANIAKIVERTSKLETNYGEAKRAVTCRKSNNHFGTKLNKRITPRAIGKARLNYAVYRQWSDGYLDIIEYVMRYGKTWINYKHKNIIMVAK